jgi:hypothetical protein
VAQRGSSIALFSFEMGLDCMTGAVVVVLDSRVVGWLDGGLINEMNLWLHVRARSAAAIE